jgi:alpha-1,6-mannosyltransferase
MVIEHRRPNRHGRTLVLVSGAALLLLAVALPPGGSRDLWSYEMYGRTVAVHHHNPYVLAPAAFPHDPFLGHVARAWRSTRSVYGPGFTSLSALIAWLAGGSALAARLAFQGLALASVAAVAVVLVRRKVPTIVLAAFVLNPLMIVWVVNGGHNDALVGLALLAAALASERARPWIVGACLAAAVSIKVAAILPALGLGWWIWRSRGVRSVVVVAATALVPVALGYAAFGGIKALRPLSDASSNVSRASLWHLMPRWHGQVIPASAPVVALVVVGLLSFALVWRHRPPGATAPATTLRATAGYLIGGGYILPWYIAWGLPLAAVEHRTRIALVVFGQSLVLAFAYTYRGGPQPDLLDQTLHVLVVASQVAALGAAAAVIAVTARTSGLRARAGQPSTPHP